MDKKFTPGPWKFKRIQQGAYDIVNTTKDKIARLWGHQNRDEETAANAALISAAPDLLEALEGYLSAQCRMLEKWAEGDENVKTTLWRNLHSCEEKARAAIAKAY